MLKRGFFYRCVPLLLMLIVGSAALAQVSYYTDSVRVANAEWRTDSLDGFTLKRYRFAEGALFCAAQHLCVIELPADSPRRLAFAYAPEGATVSQMCAATGALAAVNGSYFDMQNLNPVCYLRVDGVEVGENTPAATDSINRKYYQYAVLTLDAGRPRLLLPDSARVWERGLTDSNVMTAGPMLLRAGHIVEQRTDRTFCTRRYNRTALGIKPDGTVLIVVADGLFKHRAEGFSLDELARVLLWLGCCDAINLDGGGSTTMYIAPNGSDSTTLGVVNYPTDDAQFTHDGERRVSNAILLR